MNIINKFGLVLLNIGLALPIVGWCIKFTGILILCLTEIVGVVWWTCLRKMKGFNYAAAWFALLYLFVAFKYVDLKSETVILKDNAKKYISIIEEKDAKIRMMDAIISFREEILK